MKEFVIEYFSKDDAGAYVEIGYVTGNNIDDAKTKAEQQFGEILSITEKL